MAVENRGMSILLTVLVTVTHLLLLAKGSDGVHIDISPEKTTANMGNSVQIDCVPDGLNENLVNELSFIRVSKNDVTIASMSHCSDVSIGAGMEQRVEAEGHIGDVVGESYLKLTLKDAVSEDSGSYTCAMFYVDTSGDMKEDEASDNLVVDQLDVPALETLLNDLRNDLESLKTKVSHVSAFSAATDTVNVQFPPNVKLVLPKIVMNIGQNYNKETGIYTVPRDGLYTFQVAAFSQAACVTNLSIDVNGTTMLGRMYAYDNSVWDQSAVSVYADLRAGDQVYVYVREGNCLLHYGQLTMFTGALLKAY